MLYRPLPHIKHKQLKATEQNKAWVCGLTLIGIPGSNSAGRADVIMIVIRWWPLHQRNNKSKFNISRQFRLKYFVFCGMQCNYVVWKSQNLQTLLFYCNVLTPITREKKRQ